MRSPEMSEYASALQKALLHRDRAAAHVAGRPHGRLDEPP